MGEQAEFLAQTLGGKFLYFVGIFIIMEKVFYKIGFGCAFKNVFIGSSECKMCNHFFGIDFEEKWIKCAPYSAIQENIALKEETKQLRKEVGLLVDKILEMKGV